MYRSATGGGQLVYEGGWNFSYVAVLVCASIALDTRVEPDAVETVGAPSRARELSPDVSLRLSISVLEYSISLCSGGEIKKKGNECEKTLPCALTPLKKFRGVN